MQSKSNVLSEWSSIFCNLSGVSPPWNTMMTPMIRFISPIYVLDLVHIYSSETEYMFWFFSWFFFVWQLVCWFIVNQYLSLWLWYLIEYFFLIFPFHSIFWFFISEIFFVYSLQLFLSHSTRFYQYVHSSNCNTPTSCSIAYFIRDAFFCIFC